MKNRNDDSPVSRRRLPDWLKTRLPRGDNYFRLRSLVHGHGLHTVCESAACPNIGECWERGTLTLMILGDTCSRACRFCDVSTGRLQPPRAGEPDEVAGVLARLRPRYAVITSVDRDDLPDGGSGHWARTLNRIKARCPGIGLEALIPDFRGDAECIDTVCREGPGVLAHNLETVASLQSRVRPQCRYEWSLQTLARARNVFGLVTKSGLMLGHGETRDEVILTLEDLVKAGCKILTLGQYLRPSTGHLEVKEFIHPDVFEEYKEIGESLGLEHVEAGPLVRSSYLAGRQAQAIGL